MTDTTPNAPKAAAPAVAEAAEQAKLWILQVVIAAHRRSPAQTKIAVEALEAFIDLLAAAPQQVAAWMPISTAPKDGTGMLALWVRPGDSVTARNYALVEFVRGCWRDTENDEQVYTEPTFWQPLPAPPSQASATGEV